MGGINRCRPVAPSGRHLNGTDLYRSAAQGAGQLVLDLGKQAFLDFRHTDPADQLGEEPADHEPPGLVLPDSPGLQIEQLLVVEAAGCARVAGADDLARLDLEIRYGVGPGTVSQHQIAVELEGIRADGLLADEHVADPYRARRGALQGSFVRDMAAAVRLRVVDEEPVLEVLAFIGEVDAEQLRITARPVVSHLREEAYQLAAEGDHD